MDNRVNTFEGDIIDITYIPLNDFLIRMRHKKISKPHDIKHSNLIATGQQFRN